MATRVPLTVVIPVLDEGDQIGECLSRLDWADEVIVADGGSRDDTLALARAAGAVVLEATGPTIAAQRNAGIARARNRWVFALDHYGADKMSHGEIAALVSTKYKIDGWWAQSVTVGYERIKGLRAIGQRREGTYEANKSRTFNVPVATLFDAWADERVRRRWLDGRIGRVRSATPARSMRLDGEDRSIVAVGFMPKGRSKSAVAVQHTKLRDPETASRLKQYWSERFDALAEVLAS